MKEQRIKITIATDKLEVKQAIVQSTQLLITYQPSLVTQQKRLKGITVEQLVIQAAVTTPHPATRIT
jgi:hypothetical protein